METSMKKLLIAAICSATLLAACGNDTADDDKFEDAADARAAAAGPAVAALGLSQSQLLEADLFDAAGRELGDVEDLVRGTDGRVDRLLIEIEDSNPDRYVELPVAGMDTVTHGGETNLVANVTKAELADLPDASPAPR
jgi:hypothetical protein